MGRSELVQCGKCGLNFLHEEGLGKHMKRLQDWFGNFDHRTIYRVHEPKEQAPPSKYKCDRCAYEFESKVFFLLYASHPAHATPRMLSSSTNCLNFLNVSFVREEERYVQRK